MMTPRNRSRFALLALGLASFSCAQGPLFGEDERKAVVAYWATPGRYRADAPADAAKKGVWQVRLTPGRLCLALEPHQGQEGPPHPGRHRAARLGGVDRRQGPTRPLGGPANRPRRQPRGHRQGPAQARRRHPPRRAPSPGPIPQDLQAALGPCPFLAEAVAPLAHTVGFDDGTVLTYLDNVRLSSPRYAYYRFPQGVMSVGKAVRAMPSEALDGLFRTAGIDEGPARVMRAVSILEGGFDSVNTYDTGYVSVGFIQFASLRDGAGSLGAVLRGYKAADPLGFAGDFHRYGVDVDEAGRLVVVDPTSGSVATGADANARIIEDKRLIAVFGRAGARSAGFCAAQVRAAKAIYWPSEDTVSVVLNGVATPVRVGDLVTSEAGLATLFDRKVNTGRVDALGEAASRVAAAQGLACVEDLAKYEKTLVSMVRYRKDYLGDPALSQPAEPPAAVRLTASRSRRSRSASSAVVARKDRDVTVLASRAGKTAPGALRGRRKKT